MIKVSLDWITQYVGGQLLQPEQGTLQVESVTIDSRRVQQGDLFICIKGPNFDGHNYAEQAVSDGAIAVLTEQPLTVNAPQIVVADTHQALGALAAAVKQEVAPKTIAITGSSGKTTVKEMTASILREQGDVLSTAGNFNNDIGVPLTLLRLTRAHKYAVIELGANHRGEIAYTTSLTRPDVAMINNVAPAHVEGFGDICGVAKAKTEIFKGLNSEGVAVTWADSDFHDYWVRELADKTHRTFSSVHQQADVWAEGIQIDGNGCANFMLCTAHQRAPVQLTLPGRHNVNNALAAATCCFALGVPLAQIIRGLSCIQPVPGRMWVHELAPGVRVIDDTYNANVGSACAALDVLGSLSGHRIFVLGDMGELGPKARAYHEEVGAHAISAGIDALFSLGVLSQSASEVFNGHGGRHFENQHGLLASLVEAINTHEDLTILVKGSRSAQMEQVVESLLEYNNKKGRAAC